MCKYNCMLVYNLYAHFLLQRLKQLGSLKEYEVRLRVSVDPGGCDGFQYNYALEPQDDPIREDDLTFERHGSIVVVDETSMEFLTGATIDFVEEIAKHAFAVINNPNSESACGCGQSFAVKNFQENPAFD